MENQRLTFSWELREPSGGVGRRSLKASERTDTLLQDSCMVQRTGPLCSVGIFCKKKNTIFTTTCFFLARHLKCWFYNLLKLEVEPRRLPEPRTKPDT